MKNGTRTIGYLLSVIISVVFTCMTVAASPEQENMMKAMMFTEYGAPDVLQLREVEKPVPGEDEVLVKAYAASLNALDWHIVRGKPFFLRFFGGIMRPKHHFLGIDLAGRVEAVGSKVKGFKPGDEVFGDGASNAFAQYASVPEQNLAHKAVGISYEQAAALPVAAVTALQGLRDNGQIKTGQQVLINGASGGVGTFAVQIARAFGAEVTAVCSTRNLDIARSTGADHVIDYKKEDFTKNGRRYDLIIGANGYHWILDYRGSLKPGGIYVATGGTMAQIFQGLIPGPLISMAGDKKLSGLMIDSEKKQKDYQFLMELLETGKVVPVIDRRYTLSEVPDALRYLEAGHAQGKVIINISGSDNGSE